MKRFIQTFALAFLTLLVASAAAGYLIDPFGYFRLTGWRSSWLVGERVWADAYAAKALSAPMIDADTLFAGTSRMIHGIDVEAIADRVGTAYNLGLPGANIDEINAYIRAVMAQHPPRTLVIGLDLGQFTQIPVQRAPTLLRRAESIPEEALSVLRRLHLLFWSKALALAVQNITGDGRAATLSGVGDSSWQWRRIEADGHRGYTRSIEGRIVASQLVRSDPRLYRERMAALDRLLAHACRHGVEVKLFISPYHARLLLLFDLIGRWDAFLHWKEDLASLVDDHRKARCTVALTDFAHLSSFNSEPFPPYGDTVSTMQWYWESSHYKAALGLQIVRRLWNLGDHDQAAFGRPLTSSNIAQRLQQDSRELAELANDRPELVEELKRLLVEKGLLHDRSG